MRYYYKSTDGKGFLNLKTPLSGVDGYIQITEEEFNKLTAKPKFKPTDEQKAAIERQRQIAALKQKLADTDYIVLKIAEAISENDTETVEQLKQTYAVELNNRKVWRNEINKLEAI